MQQRAVGATGLTVSRLGLGTMSWGRETDEHEARDQLIAFAEAGGTLVDTAAGYADGASEVLIGRLIGDVVARDEIVIATKGGISRRSGERETYASRGRLLADLDGSLRRLGVDHVDLWQVHTWVDGVPIEETLTALDHARLDRPRVVRRHLQLHRLADRPGRDLAAGRSRTGGAGVDADGVLPAQPPNRVRRRPGRRRARARASCRGRRSVTACSPASTAAASPPTPAVPRSRSAGFIERYLDARCQGVIEGVAKAAEGLGLVDDRGRAGLGARPPRRDRTDRRRAHRQAAARARSASRT